MKLNVLYWAVLLVVTVGCTSMGMVPALRISSGNSNGDIDRLLLETALAEMLDGADVQIASDALLDNPEIIIERRRQNIPGSAGSVQGRDTGMPDHFRLWKRGDTCLLEHVESARLMVLEDVACVEYQP